MSDEGIFDLEIPSDIKSDRSDSENSVGSDSLGEMNEDGGHYGEYKLISASLSKSNIEKVKKIKKNIFSEDEGYHGQCKIISPSLSKSDIIKTQNIPEKILSDDDRHFEKYKIILPSLSKSNIKKYKKIKEKILSEDEKHCKEYKIISASLSKTDIIKNANMQKNILSEDERLCVKYKIISPSLNKSDIVKPKHIKEKIQPSDFQFLRVLGMGAFGKVYQVRKVDSHDGSRIMALKVLKKKVIIESKKETTHIKAERHILEVAKHPFIVELFYAFQTEKKLYLALQYLPGGELYSRLCKEGIFIEDEVRFYSAELILALEYLHSIGILYRDLKPENILLDNEGHVKLIDFGLSKENIFCDSTTLTICGTLEYMAPEIITKEGHGRSADWWSLGVLIYDMLTGVPPFTGENRKKTIEKIIKGKFILQPYLTTEAASLIKKLLKRKVSKRLGSRHDDGDQVKAHSFYTCINWNNVIERKLIPPFVPKLSGGDDASLFDNEYIKNVPVESSHGCALSETNKMLFDNFTYVAPFLVENSMAFLPDHNLPLKRKSTHSQMACI